MLIYLVTFISFILFFICSLPFKQLQPWANEMRLLSLYALFSVLYPLFYNTKSVETNASMESRLLDLPALAIETILEKLEPADLCTMACVSNYFRDICLSDYLWKRHMTQKWGRIIGLAAQKEWKLHIASQKERLSSCEDGRERKGFFKVYLSKLWSVVMLKSSHNDGRKSSEPRNTSSILSFYRALETGKFCFPAQVFNRENGHVGFIMSCYDAELTYNCHTDTFEARYQPHGSKDIPAENGVTWERLREAPVDKSPRDLHISDCLDGLRPRDHIEIQWRRNKHFPYGWWYGVIGHLESCDGNVTFCRCHESDTVVLEFKQYAPGSRWERMTINRRDHLEEGNEIEGFYAGIRKLYNKDEISMWQQFWPTDILE